MSSRLPGVIVEFSPGNKLTSYLRPGRLMFYYNYDVPLVIDVDSEYVIRAVELPRIGYCITDIRVVNGKPREHIVSFGTFTTLFSELLTDVGFTDFVSL